MTSLRRTLALFLVLTFGHVLLISVQVQSKSGMPIVQAAAFAVFVRVQQLGAGIAGIGSNVWHNYIALRGVAAESEALRRRVLELEGQVQAHAALVQQTQDLEGLLRLQQSVVAPTLAARVLAGDAAPGAWFITIDRGSMDGVEPNMAVIGQYGVVGRVVNRPTAHAAQVQLIIGRQAAAGAMTEESQAAGVVRGGSGTQTLEMDFVDVLKDVRVGERVLTSGLDGIFPRGFVIGTVERAVKGSGVYSDLRVRPAVDFSRTHMVLVVVARPAAVDGGVQ
ncbi:MAG: rod shape-determining protein MreC [Acidobacteria bacterium]|nr:rod shape-determining protein MreC [Acidobacteriota bacterium]